MVYTNTYINIELTSWTTTQLINHSLRGAKFQKYLLKGYVVRGTLSTVHKRHKDIIIN
jgi:hypothetical protein